MHPTDSVCDSVSGRGPGGKIPVLAVVGSDLSAHQATTLFHRAKPWFGTIGGEAALPEAIEPDPAFPPIPIGPRAADCQDILLRTGKSRHWRLNALEKLRPRPQYLRGGFLKAGPGPIPESIEGVPLFSDPFLHAYPDTCFQSDAVGCETEVRQALLADALARQGLDGEGVLIAVMDEGLNADWLDHHTQRTGVVDRKRSWTWCGAPSKPGKYPFNHGTRSAFNALLLAPRATLLDFPILQFNVYKDQRCNRLGGAYLAYNALAAHVARDRLRTGAPRALVVNNSWYVMRDFEPGHPGRYIDNPRHPFNQKVMELARLGADIVFCAGNCGPVCPDPICPGARHPIMGANALRHVLTVAACDLNRQPCGFSSRGPGIPGMSRRKPDLTAYSHFLSANSRHDGVRKPDSGTSTSCPVVSGCIAALRTRLSPLHVPPRRLFKVLRKTADRMGKRWNPASGRGLVNPVRAARKLGLIRALRRVSRPKGIRRPR